MATIVFVDQENGDIRSMLPKDHGTFLSSKPQSRKGVVSFPGKVFGDSEIVSKPSRKALGNVNKQILQNKAVMAQKINFKQNTGSIGKKVTSSNLQPVKDLYPEIEHYFPYNPLGVSLLVQDNEVVRFDALTNIQLCPLEMPLFNTDSDCLPSLISPLYEVTVDLPPFEDY
ncbi:hypothetical protein XENTR_v10011379 [Xenopus tropicalis]|uniref:Securin n=1 Tax=Xenopus tropicalis TaxID=8364 RepID=A0A8J0R2E2_XENTR|nr:securin isoform X6 [Xenopus tropicalis]KAE8608034.1 hypothetical protein XENTR_v10011379 [Xenopus tropicalis]|eukprot:XP_004913552.1 PREDICTED: securin-like isoform X6 [Xenopus tropicalis]